MPETSGPVDLCELREIADPGSRGFVLERRGGDEAYRLFVVHKAGQVTAFRNRCPHTGAPLEWQPDRFLDLDDAFIQCAIHGALFRPEDGYCLRGPCAGQSLESLPVAVSSDGRVRVILPLVD